MWEHIPEEWQRALLASSWEDIVAMRQGLSCPEWPVSLKEFCQRAYNLTLNRKPKILPATLASHFTKNMRPKKVHEVTMVSPLINQMCKALTLDAAVDLG